MLSRWISVSFILETSAVAMTGEACVPSFTACELVAATGTTVPATGPSLACMYQDLLASVRKDPTANNDPPKDKGPPHNGKPICCMLSAGNLSYATDDCRRCSRYRLSQSSGL